MNVTTSLAKGATTIPVANAASFNVGDIIQIDQLDDTSYLYEGMANNHYFKRSSMDYGPSTSAPRSMGQTVEVTGKSGNTLTILASRFTFRSRSRSSPRSSSPRRATASGSGWNTSTSPAPRTRASCS